MDTQLYPGIPFSPPAALTDNVGAGDTIIPVSDVEAFPPAPNLATIGADEEGETILYAAKTATALSGCTRGVEGTARVWSSGEPIARNWTAKDHADLIAAVGEAAEAAQNAHTEAQEAKVGSDPAGTAVTVVSTHNSDSTAHEDIRTAAHAALEGHNEDSEAHGELFAAKQDTLTGTPGQVVGFNAQGAAQAVRGWSNPNLLDNWYFADPVNQRGQTEYTGDGYVIDRWHKHPGTTLSIQSGFVRWCANTVDFQVLIQVLENTQLIGKEVTASYLVRTNNKDAYSFSVRKDSRVFPQAENEWTLVTVTGVVRGDVFSISGGRPYVSIQVQANAQPNDYIDIKAIKLELGPVQTLAHQDADGSWVLNDPPPNKALELAKCQRYQLVVDTNMRIRVSQITPTTLDFFVPIPASMRTVPTISTPSALGIFDINPGIEVTGFAFSIPIITNNGIFVRATKSSNHGMADAQLRTKNRCIFDANL